MNRFEVEFDWPECHKPRCPHEHGEPERALGLMQQAVIESIENELRFETVTRPDRSCDDDSPEDTAMYTLASLLNTYNVHHAGTFVKAARLLLDAYPALVPALASIGGN
ncbi:hypothetical protein B4915_02145 [Leucobacter massiliensis]|uniref:Uncharacterized protein n=1 Tax=Leucobacter massiliensis TaxID=1686285 RepID=A0A2S9QQM8_9MICO|nr:hypothetical protein B4915_02145 [Leucobacter massiliensis]